MRLQHTSAARHDAKVGGSATVLTYGDAAQLSHLRVFVPEHREATLRDAKREGFLNQHVEFYVRAYP